MEKPGIVTVDEASASRVLDIITLAFDRDPVARFFFSTPEVYLHWWPRWVMAIGKNGFAAGGVEATEDFCAGAIWLPPGVETDPADVEALDMPEGDPEEDALIAALQAAMADYHPSEPHWYLWTLGADPSVQGQGYGALLLEHRLAEIDERGEPAYLEASSPGLVPFYKRFGFEQIGLIDVDPVPPLVPMFRRPR